jgi:superfamily II DNA or RNA helicase
LGSSHETQDLPVERVKVLSRANDSSSSGGVQPHPRENEPELRTRRALIRRYYNVIEVSPDGRSAISAAVREALTPQMIYTHVKHLYGADQFWVDPATGEREQRNMAFEKRRLYKLDDKGRLVCGRGYFDAVVDTLEGLGYQVFFQDLTPAGPRPHAYEENWELVDRHVDYRPRQREALELLAANDIGVFDAAPGMGKTFLMSAASLLYPKARFAMITKGKDRMAHLMRELTQFIPTCGKVGGGGKNFSSRVTVYSADSLHHYRDGDADFMMVDEVHEMMADKYVEAMARLFRTTRNFGLSATTAGRADGTDARLESMFGRTIFKMTQQESEALGLVVPVDVRWLDVIMAQNPCTGMQGPTKKRWGIWRNYERNATIAEAANAHPDAQVLIIVETVEHAVYLAQHLPDFELCYGTMSHDTCQKYIEHDMLPVGYTPLPYAERKLIQEEFAAGTLKKVIATDVWSTGVSFEQLQVMIRADARGSKILDTQIPGRVDRISEGKSVGIVYDCMDQFDDEFRGKARGREKNYKKRGWQQVKPVRTGRQMALALND